MDECLAGAWSRLAAGQNAVPADVFAEIAVDTATSLGARAPSEQWAYESEGIRVKSIQSF